MSERLSTAVAYEVTIGSATFKQSEEDGLQVITVEDHVDMVSMMTVRAGGAEGQPEWNFKVGDEAKCKLGEGTEVFQGEVVAVEPGYQVEGKATMTIRCLDKSHRLGRGRKTRFWEEKKDSDVAEEVGSECGLSVDADATEETLPYILQRNESNMAFIKRLAARNNFVVRVSEGKLLFKKQTFDGSSETVEMGESLRSMRMSQNTSDMVSKVVVRGWDTAAKSEIVGECEASSVEKIGDGELGATEASCFGEAVAYITDVPVSSQGMANAVAKAEMERIARQFLHGSCTIQGNDKVLAGTMLEFKGLPTGQNGKVFVMATRHIVSVRSGYTTEVTFCSNTKGS